jgi:cytochrome c oxidase cbb3-type subunit 3
MGCEREQRRFAEVAPAAGAAEPVRASPLQPGEPKPPPGGQPARAPAGPGPYDGNAWAVSQGKQLYVAFNCAGCHANGGGGIGPALMDDTWIYGGEPAQIYASIVEGRPNGMPSFAGKIPEQQTWQIVAYVRSMSGHLRKDVRSGRGDHLQAHPSEQRR